MNLKFKTKPFSKGDRSRIEINSERINFINRLSI